MIKKVFASIILILCLNLNSFAWGPEYIGIPSDKYMHTITAWLITDYVENEFDFEWWQSMLLINALGIAKEWSDTKMGGEYSIYDIMANNTGWLCAHVVFNFEF